MAKSNLARANFALRDKVGLQAGVALALAVGLVEVVNAALDILSDRFHFDSARVLSGGGTIGAAVARFFDQLRKAFGLVSGLLRHILPSAEISLIFAAGCALAAYVLIESRKGPRAQHRTVLPLAILVVAALPIVMSILSTMMR